MTSRIFRSILTVAISVLLAGLLIITGVMYEYFGGVQEKQLRDELSFAAKGTEQLGEDYLKALDAADYRLTWVDQEGNVLFDNNADVGTMENHADRKEIREALSTGTGRSSRYSSTLTQKTLYEAVRLSDGSVLRISVSSATVAVLILGMLQPILLVGLLAIALSAWLAHRMAKRVVQPLNDLDLENPLDNDVYEELSPLLRRINSQHLEIKNQMQDLRNKQEEFDQITGCMKEGLVLLDAKDKIVSINPAARSLFDAKGMCVGEDFLTVNRSRDMRLAVSNAHRSGRSEFRSSIGGREYQFDLSRIESEGSVHGVVILAFDVTEQVDAERSRREFTANVSHELKTPLQSIIGSAELIENGIVKPDDLPRFAGHIHKEASRLLTLIEDIIRLSQLDEGTEMPREAVSLKAISEEVRDTLSETAKTKGISMSVSGDEGMVNGVRRLLYEIIYNLCDNAVKYNSGGGNVDITISDSDNNVCLTVSDNGIGIAPEHQSKIFERFYRVDKSHSKQSGGTGLGLSIVKHAVQYHNGKINISSEEGRGTRFSVTLPLSNSENSDNME